MKPTYYLCGICEHYHPIAWNGDCRDDVNRFTGNALHTKHGEDGWEEASIFQKPIGGDQKKNPTLFNFRHMTEEEIRELKKGQSIQFIANDDRVRSIRVTNIKTWKRQPERFELGLKYGMYEHVRWELEMLKKRLVVQL